MPVFDDYFMGFINIEPANIRVGQVGCWSGVSGGKSLNKKKEDTNSRIESTYDMFMHPQRAIIPLQGLDRRAQTVGAISGPYSQDGGLL